MTDGQPAAIPLDAYPDPALTYEVTAGDVVVRATNDAAKAVFDEITVDVRLQRLFDQFSVVRSTEDDPLGAVRSGDDARFYLDGGEAGPYVVRVVSTAADAGILVFTELGDPLTDGPGVDRVASVISHDLRNPLDVAKAHLCAARETGDDEHFDAVANAHDRMNRIVGDVLTLAGGHNAVDPSPSVSFEAAIADAWQAVGTDEATLALGESLPTRAADPDRLRRLFENLLRNAVEHGSATLGDAAPASATVTVTVGALDDGIYVADDGPGIPPGERDVVFEPGYTIAGNGTGLGLAIVDRIVTAHGWELTLTTGDKGGARFEVRF
ncbi:sensor histidine kinase [Haloarchaeobius sp. DFWS5]|uniref:sensor histidine kinase n=1 Tax=Haloarchaeobius sp. DFWS5 TaxID=3446114 RepID=UPI003EBFE516